MGAAMAWTDRPTRRRNRPWARLAGAALLAALALPWPDAAAQKPSERFTPLPAPTVSLPRLTPSGNVQVQGLAPGAALRPAPVVTPFLSAIQGPGAPPTATPPQPAARTEPVPPPSAPPMAAPEKPAPEKPSTSPRTATATVVTTAGVRLRAAPKSGARVLDTVERGETLEAFGPPADGWVRVGRGGRPLGYIAADHLAETGAGKADHPASGRYAKAAPEDRGCALPDDLPGETRRPLLPAGTVARVLADANLRVAPACDAKVEDVLERGERVTVQDSTGSWYRVGREGRSLGYVGAALLVPVKGR
ncbi:SH3 domain-containing protein [Azospirillum doebereinerae]|uniref:SH3 domain-containing protein n=1 Tax=Azospirillum doebereinerae TaxID=92933 RepID=UPI001EE5EE1A|nr:SH3 domain-containing protein [Azospirillum doebereinerae]MCG5242556.1 SH3 domain-containing protein [Azospirillum doebereinerae]